MRSLFKHRGLRLIFIANLVSMIGSGMNTAVVTWFILQATHSEMSLGTAISSTMMEMVPKHFMGRVQNTFFFIGTCLQLISSIAVGAIAEHISLALAFAVIGAMYGIAAITAYCTSFVNSSVEETPAL